MGIVITASHNPPEYNGYKVYGEDGAQLNLEDAEVVIQHVNDAGDAIHIDQRNPDKKLVIQLDEIMDQAYMDALKIVQENGEFASSSDLKVVFTPLHGASGKTVKRILSEVGYEHISRRYARSQPHLIFS